MVESWISEKSILGLVLHGSWVSQLVLLVLLLMSSFSWAVIFLKWMQYRKVQAENQEFLEVFHKENDLSKVYPLAKEFELSSFAKMFDQVYREVSQFRKKLQQQEVDSRELAERCDQRLKRVTERIVGQQAILLDRRLNMLATISSAAPFIGLFGTVLGIINSFQSIGTTGVTSLAVVAPGISEALVATAAGLLAAIPALMFYNLFRGQSRRMIQAMEHFGLELGNRIEWILV